MARQHAALVLVAVAASSLASVAEAAAFTPGNLAVLRCGDGFTALGTNGARFTVVEMDYTTGAVVQEIPIPVPNATGAPGGCVAGQGAYYESISRSVDGRYLVFPCYNQVTSASGTNTTLRTVVRIASDGVPDLTTTFVTNSVSELVRSAVSVDGSRFWVGTSNGVKLAEYGWAGRPQISVSLNTTVRGITILGLTQLWAATNNAGTTATNAGVARLSTAALPTAFGTSAVSGIIQFGRGIGNPYAVVFEDNVTAYVTADSDNIGLHKFVWTGAAWANASGYPKPCAQVSFLDPATSTVVTPSTSRGLKGLMGVTDPVTGVFTLVATTLGAGTSSYVLKYNTATETWSLLARSPSGFYDYRNAAPVPIPPSPLPPTAAPTASATGSSGASASPSSSLTSSATPSLTPSGTPTATPALCTAGGPRQAMAPAGTSVLVVRVGNGTSPLPSAGFKEFWLDEVSLATGALLQSVYVSAEPADGGCTLSTVFPTEGIAARTLDGQAVLVPCWGRGPHPTGANVAAGVAKVVLRVDAAGGVASVASFIDGAQYFRSVQAASAQAAGDTLLAYTSSGVHNVSLGVVNATGPYTTTAGAYRGSVMLSPGRVYAVTTSAGVAVLSDTDSPLGAAPAYLPGITSTTNAGWVAVKDANTLFLTDWQGSGSIQRWALSPSSGNWEASGAAITSMSLTWQGSAYTTATARGTVGLTDPATGNYVLLFTTATVGAYAGGGNFLVKYGA